MTCSICKSNSHNKRKCPDKDRAQPPPPPPKKPMGRPRKYPRIDESAETAGQQHHSATANPSRLGRGGRITMTGRAGSRSAGRGGSSGRGTSRGGRAGGRAGRSGGRGRLPQGFGVLFDTEGNAFTNAMGSTSGPTSVLPNEQGGPSTQVSINK